MKFRSEYGIDYSFDEKGDMLGEYDIYEYHLNDNKLNKKITGKWTKKEESLLLNRRFTISSICGKPCASKYVKVPLKLECCWECKRCRENEILIKNNTECGKCSQFYWPGK